MTLDPDHCYNAILAHDSRFDGRFFVGVRSTGVYCRPVCRVRTPRRENCRYFASAAAAEQHGFRPCLRCRPELAPGFASVDARHRLAQSAARLIDAGEGDAGEGPTRGLAAIAGRLGTTDRHLRRVFGQEFGVSPLEYAQTRRMLLAKQLLTDTDLPVTDVAFAAGFGSLRRFNASFRERYQMAPSRLRASAPARPQDRLRFRLAYRQPFDWEHLLGFLGDRTIEGVESVASGRYRRTVRIAGRPLGPASPVGEHRPGGRAPTGAGAPVTGWIEVRPLGSRGLLEVDLSASLAGVVPRVLERVRRLFDLDCSPQDVSAALGELAAARPGVRLPGAFDGFELSVRAVLGQQITVKAARTLAGRFARALGEPLDTPFEGLDTVFPSAERIAGCSVDDIGRLGVIATRSRSILALAQQMSAGTLVLEPAAPVEPTLAALRAVPGIGDWTAQYIAMRALAWPDAFPAADYGVLKALGGLRPAEALRRAEAWRPWRAYAVMHLWAQLGAAAAQAAPSAGTRAAGAARARPPRPEIPT
jgi:AraC family transcriptional regulator of adaptative response / DNA-3-methyladenine glycosylase II